MAFIVIEVHWELVEMKNAHRYLAKQLSYCIPTIPIIGSLICTNLKNPQLETKSLSSGLIHEEAIYIQDFK